MDGAYLRFCAAAQKRKSFDSLHALVRDHLEKRLEEGTYAVPLEEGGAERRRELTPQELGAILSGIDLTQAVRRKRYRRSE